MQGEEQKWRKIYRAISKAWIIRDPGVQGNTIHNPESEVPLTGLKSQRAIIIFMFSEGNSGGSIEGKGSYNSVPVNHLRNDKLEQKPRGVMGMSKKDLRLLM